MPTEIPLIRATHRGNLVAIHLETDARHFWRVIQRHAMRFDSDLSYYAPRMGSTVSYRAYPDIRDDVPENVEKGVYVWEEGYYADGNEHSSTGYWAGVRIAWETIAPTRLRVVIAGNDLPSNLEAAYDVLSAIYTAYPESRSQLSDIAALVESWAYDEKTAAWWRERMMRRGVDSASVAPGDPSANAVPEMPPPVGTNGWAWDDVFDWWYRGGRLHFRHLKDLAPLLGVAEKTIYNRHDDYKKQYDEKPKPDDESRVREVQGSNREVYW